MPPGAWRLRVRAIVSQRMSSPDPPRTRDGHSPATEETLYGRDFAPGAQIGGYRVESLRARGGFATVYQATHVVLGRRVAIKVLHQLLCGSPTMLKRFQQEAQSVNLIRHPNIVDVHEFGELTDGRPYFVMEWLEGRDLEHVLRERGPLAAPDVLQLLEDLGAALAAAHAVGVIHRDLKASNVVLIPAGDWFLAKLVDFGIAKLIDRAGELAEHISSTGVRLGTPWNMAPEQILGRPVDRRTDIYALGVLIYQMLAGELPFRAATPVEVEALHLNAAPPRLSQRAPVSAAIDAVIQRCLEKEPDRRYATVEAVLHDLRHALMEMPPRPSAPAGPSIAVHVAFERPADDAEALDQLDAERDQTRATLLASGFEIALESAQALMAVRRLSELSDTAVAERRAAVSAALAIASEHATITVHEDWSMRSSDWMSDPSPGEVLITDALQRRLAETPPPVPFRLTPVSQARMPYFRINR
jgi:eukaryotic-like serine/threonine-protein kinase